MDSSGRFTHVVIILDCLGQVFMQLLYLGRAPRTKETLPDFLKWRRVIQLPLVFRGLTGSQRTPGFGASHNVWEVEWISCSPYFSRFQTHPKEVL